MSDTDLTIAQIHRAFGSNEYPGDEYLQGSREGSEPFDQVGPFRGRREPAGDLARHLGEQQEFFSALTGESS